MSSSRLVALRLVGAWKVRLRDRIGLYRGWDLGVGWRGFGVRWVLVVDAALRWVSV